MARRRRRGGGRHKVPVIPLVILGSQGFLAWNRGGGDPMGAANNFQMFYTGYDLQAGRPVFDLEHLGVGYIPWIAYGIGKRFISRYASRMFRGLPVTL